MTSADALEQVVLARIRELWEYRAWWASHRWADWPAERSELQRELRALVRLARKARAIAAEERPKELRLQWPAEVRARSSAASDPIDLAKAYAEWQDAAPGELTEAWGR